MKRFLSVLLIVALMLTLVACGKSAAGTYNLKSMTEGGETITAKDLTDLGMDADFCKLILNKDGTGSLSMFGETIQVTWDDKYITAEGDSVPYTLKGNTLTMSESGSTIVFEKK